MHPQERKIARHDVARPPVLGRVEPVDMPQPKAAPVPLWHRVTSTVLQAVLAAAILAGGYYGYGQIMASDPMAQRGEPERVARLVKVTPAVAAEQGPVIGAWGEVVAAETLVARPEVSGTVVWVNPDLTPGGILDRGEALVRIDTRDLELAIDRAKADIAGIEARMRIERGQAQVGQRELTRLSRDLTDEQRALVSREPQMQQLEAELASARATLAQAENELARAEVRAPFDAVVIGEEVAEGAMVADGSEIARLVAVDRFHVMLSVPTGMLKWIGLDGAQAVTLRQPEVWPDGATREGRVTRLGAALSETGRMAELIVTVPDPLSIRPGNAGAPKLLLGSYVEGEIEGAPVEGAVAIDRAWLRDGDTVWVMGEDDRLEVRPVEIVWRGAGQVLATGGLSPGERIVTTPLSTHSEGMALRVRDEGAVTAAAGETSE